MRLPALESINVDENNPNYVSEDGVLFDKKKETLLFFPRQKETTEYEAPPNLKKIAPFALVLVGGVVGVLGVAILAGIAKVFKNALKS